MAAPSAFASALSLTLPPLQEPMEKSLETEFKFVELFNKAPKAVNTALAALLCGDGAGADEAKSHGLHLESFVRDYLSQQPQFVQDRIWYVLNQ
jgi:hypothetical protein